MVDLTAENYRAALLQVELDMQGMVAENRARELRGEAPAYGDHEFGQLSLRIDQLRLDFNR